MNILRYGSAIVAGFFITVLLFFIMQLLIATGENAIVDKLVGYKVEIGEVRPPSELELKDRKPPKPEQPEAPPEAPELPQVDTSKPAADGMSMTFNANFTPQVAAGGIGIGAPSDGDYLPIVRVQPIYPRRAQERGIEGYAIVSLTVTAIGTTQDIRVIEGQPQGMFDSAAVKAAEKFKYKPKVVNGEPVPVSGVLYKFTFELEQ